MESSETLSQRQEASRALRASSFRKSWNSRKQIRALLSIRPPYAEAIFRGEKRFEFRRAIFRKAVDVVVVYTTNPTGLVVGEFDVAEIISESVEELWSRTRLNAGIDRGAFLDYFKGRSVGHAIVIGSVRRYRKPLELAQAFGIRAPQSFVYV
jgi:predicted transcriptional regulator